jgi:shikimate 5-dehydrogenase
MLDGALQQALLEVAREVAAASERTRELDETRMRSGAISEAELARAEVLVNASGIGVEEGQSPIPTELLPQDRYVLDLVFNRASTPLIEAARASGGTAANGQGAFLAGCAETMRLLTGSAPATDVLRKALASELGVPVEGLAVVGD